MYCSNTIENGLRSVQIQLSRMCTRSLWPSPNASWHPNNYYGTDALTEILLRRNINILEIPGLREIERSRAFRSALR